MMLWRPFVTLLDRRPGTQGEPGVDVLVVPGAAQPGMFGIVDDLPRPFLAGSCHHIQVVHVIAGRRDGRTVVPVWHEYDVAGADLFEYLDGTVRCAVHAVVPE